MAAPTTGEPTTAPAQHCHTANELVLSDDSPTAAAVMFSAGVLGNVLALALLLQARRRRRARRERLAPFHVLVMALVLTDLLGTCLLSPVVLAAYGRGRALRALAEGERVCLYFAFAMSFFGLATMGCLGLMALERCLAISAPYLYERLLGGRPAALLLGALPALYGLAAAFCALPLLGFGRYVQYCPGTWCFIQMRLEAVGGGRGQAPSGDRDVLTFSLLYASLLLLLILAVLFCNACAIVHLVRMHRRGKAAWRGAALSAASLGARQLPLRQREARDGHAEAGPGGSRGLLSMFEELEHLILLAIMTIAFAVCSLPFTIQAFMNNFMPDEDPKGDLQALRFLSMNCILDPWVFTILRPPVLRLMRSMLCCAGPFKSRTKNRPSPLAKPKPVEQVAACRR